jgi:hypothetical protein
MPGDPEEETATGRESSPPSPQTLHQPQQGLMRDGPPHWRTSQMRNNGGCPPSMPQKRGPAWLDAYQAWSEQKSMVVRQRLSVAGNKSPNKRAGANLNPRLTLALVAPKSLIAPKGGAARPALHPEGGGNTQRAPAVKLWGPRRRGEGRGRGWYRSASERRPSRNAYLDHH